MATEKCQVLWSPNKDSEFAIYGNELKVYQYLNIDESYQLIKSDIPLSSSSIGRLVAVSTEVACSPLYQTVAWQPNKDQSYCFAIGQTNGKVSLINLLSKQGHIGSYSYQLSPKTLGRPCNCVAWNPNDNRLLAVGLEKARSDSSLIVWDINQARAAPLPPQHLDLWKHLLQQMTGASSSKQGDHAGHGENTSSLAWLQENTLVAGMGSRYLKVFDIREEHGVQTTTSPREYAQHKGIYGLSVDPVLHYQLASYAEGNSVYMWDTRMFQKPLYHFQRPGNVLHLSWLATRPGCLSVVFSEAPYLRLIDIPYLSPSVDTPDSYAEYLGCHIKDRYPLLEKHNNEKSSVMSLQWHNQWENKGLIINTNGKVKDITVYDKSPLSWGGCNDSMVYGRSEELIPISSHRVLQENDDISVIMKNRVKQEYGFNISKNIEITADNLNLQSAWMWLNKQKPSKLKKSIQGVVEVLEGVSDSVQSPPHSFALPFSVYTSQKRSNALELCGWSFFNNKESLEAFMKSEELSGRYERAAAIAVFQGDLSMANNSLRIAASNAIKKANIMSGSLYNLIALSLSGYSPNEPSLWQETCIHIKSQITHPYLRALFTFLSASNSSGNFQDILNDPDLLLQDRVAFSCIYLNDTQLKNNLDRLKRDVISHGMIEGLFLTGLTEDGISLVANYVNNTGDIQTACFIFGEILSNVSKYESHHIVEGWFEGYRDLLDQWKMWKERAQFDYDHKIKDTSYKPAKHSIILCTFCSKAISGDALRQDRLKGSTKKSTSCPSCRKPLPRCSLCLLHMTTGCSKVKSNGSNQFSQWFTWCQTCRHGGHATHIMEWFQSHKVCPVTDCHCHCLALDSAAR